MFGNIVLYDLPSRGTSTCWSYNPWKIRLALNFKGLPYETEWVDYPDLVPKFKTLGLAPNETGRPYTIPTVKVPSGQLIMDGLVIAQALEKLYPEPSLHVDSPQVQRAQDAVTDCWNALAPLLANRVPTRILQPRSADYFLRTREEKFGMPLSELEKSEKAMKAWDAAKEPFRSNAGNGQ